MSYQKSIVAIIISLYPTAAWADDCRAMVTSQVGKSPYVELRFSTMNVNGVASYSDILAGIIQHTPGSYYVRGEANQIFSDRRDGTQRFAENKADRVQVTFLVDQSRVNAVEVYYPTRKFSVSFLPICEASLIRGWAGGAGGHDVHYMIKIRAGIVPPPPSRPKSPGF